MNFELTEEQKMIVDAVKSFVDRDSPITRSPQMRTTEVGWEAKVWKTMADNGWLAVSFPEEQGGYGGCFVDTALILEQLGRGLVPEPYIASVVLAGGLLSRLGTTAQIGNFLAPMLEGRTTLAFAYAERQGRYETTDCETTATRSGHGYTLSGEKVWVLNGHAADMFAEVELCKGMMILAAIQADSQGEHERKAAISAAKVQLQQGGWFVQENAVQLFGGIAITDEQDVGLYFKRIRVLQGLFGDADCHLGRYSSLPG